MRVAGIALVALCAWGCAGTASNRGADAGADPPDDEAPAAAWSCVVGPRYCYDFSADWEVEVLARICRNTNLPGAPNPVLTPTACAEAGRIGSCRITPAPLGSLLRYYAPLTEEDARRNCAVVVEGEYVPH